MHYEKDLLRKYVKAHPQKVSLVLIQHAKVTFFFCKTCCWSPASIHVHFLITAPTILINLYRPDNVSFFGVCLPRLTHFQLHGRVLDRRVLHKWILHLAVSVHEAKQKTLQTRVAKGGGGINRHDSLILLQVFTATYWMGQQWNDHVKTVKTRWRQ